MPVTPTDIVNEAIQRDRRQPAAGHRRPAELRRLARRQGGARALHAGGAGGRAPLRMGHGAQHGCAHPPGNAAPFGWALEYLYPANGIEVWQLTPAALADANNPLPTNWVVANALVGGVQTKVIHTDTANARAIYNNSPGEALWDPLFRQAVVAQLASAFAMALFGKPDVAQAEFDMGNAIAALAELRDS
jgi:hypothetical protein